MEKRAEHLEEIHQADGMVFLSRSIAIPDEAGNYLYSRHNLIDITELVQARTRLAEQEDKHRTLLENLPQRVFYKDRHSVYIACNSAYARDLKLLSADAIAGKDDFTFYPQALAEKYRSDDQRIIETGITEDIEEPYIQDGNELWAHTVRTPVRDSNGEVIGVLGIFWDVTLQRQALERIKHLDRMYRTISRGNQALVRATDELTLAKEVCEVLVDHGGFHSACVVYGITPADAVAVAQAGLNHRDAGRIARAAARYADEIGFEQLDQGPPLSGPGPEQHPVFSDITGRHGLGSLIVLPLRMDNGTTGMLWVGSKSADAFDSEVCSLLLEMAGDLAFGISNIRAQAERFHLLEQLGHSLDHAVTAIAATVEMRDPYTAGHQRRVAKLAAAMAQELGMDAERIKGVHMAGIVHDIGKIHVPAEILASPAKLTDAEFEIIKTHSRSGWEILKGIDFPWPVAEIVLQHHEKLDGSGYPDGLKGTDILLEARILSVADVVEAMASHRPYRPGFGIFPALQEVSRRKGMLYDKDVVDVCLRMFLEKGYEL